MVYRHGLVQGGPQGRTELAYQVEVTNKKNIRDMVFVTAVGGKVVNRYSLVNDALHRILFEAEAQAERHHPVQARSGRKATTATS